MKILKYKAITSTNTTLLDLSKKGAKSWTVIWADQQTEGKGYSGNSWKTQDSKNLLFSVLIKSDLKHKDLIYFNQWVSNCVCRILENYTDDVFVKWPNDIIIRDKKVCGILIETYRSENELNIIVGVGLNVNQTDFGEFQKAGSLSGLTGIDHDRGEILSELLTVFSDNFDLIEQKDWKRISEEYHQKLFRKDQPSFFKKQGILFKGTIRGVARDGSLKVETETGEICYFMHKQIELMY